MLHQPHKALLIKQPSILFGYFGEGELSFIFWIMYCLEQVQINCLKAVSCMISIQLGQRIYTGI